MIETALQVVTPGVQAISTADAKTHLRVDYATTADNTEIDNMVKVATKMVEAFTGRICMPTVYDFHLTGFPRGGIVLPVSPISALTSVKYYSDATTWVTMTAVTDYYSNLYEEPLTIRYTSGNAIQAYQYRFDAVTVRFTAGYADAASVPKSIRQAILLLLGDLYEHRSDAVREKFTLWQMTCYGDRIIHTPNENSQ